MLFNSRAIPKKTFRALVLCQPSHVVNSVYETKSFFSNDYVIICVRVPPSRIPVPFLVFDIEFIKALTNEIAPYPTSILTKRINEIDYNRF